MAKTTDRDKIEYMEGLLTQLVTQIEAMHEEAAGAAIRGEDISADYVVDQLDDLLRVEDPGGKVGALTVDENGLCIMLGARVTGEREISTRPGDFNGVVWDEDMDRAPKDEDE